MSCIACIPTTHYINDSEDNKQRQVFRKVKNDGDKQHLQNDLDKLINGLKNGRCYSILGNVNAYTQDTGPWM